MPPRELSPAEIRRVFREEATRGAKRAALATVREVQKRTPRKTGQAQRSITAGEPRVSGETISVPVGSNVAHVRYLDEGTGIYGPKHQKITPKAKQALAFVATGAKGPGQPFTLAGRARRSASVSAVTSGLVVVRSVKGIQPLHMFRDGIVASREARLRELRAVGPRITERLGLGAR